MKSNGDPNRYAVYIPEHYHRVVEVVAKNGEDAAIIAQENLSKGLYDRAPLVFIDRDATGDWLVSQIEGCC